MKEYKKENLTIIWKLELCEHAAECIKGLPQVFNDKKRPWINLEMADKQEVIDVVKKCPSGALTYKED